MTLDELIALRNHADAVVKIIRTTMTDENRLTRQDLKPDTVDKAVEFFLSIYPNSLLKKVL